MKTIEQKARAYDEVIRKLRGMMPNWERLSYNGKTFLQDLIYIIPELAESEDEKIRKWIINEIKIKHHNLDEENVDFVDKAIAWLEKQKEYESTDFEYVWDRTDCGELTAALDKYSEEAIINMCHAWYDKGIELERKSWLKKQGQGQVKESTISQHENKTCEENGNSLTYKDERIRKSLIRNFTNQHSSNFPTADGFTREQILSWLERQGDYANFRDKAQVGDRITKNEDGILVNLSQLNRVAKAEERQGEQKPAEFDDTNAKRMFIKALERVEEQNAKGYKLTDCDKNSWWEDFKAYTYCTIEQKSVIKMKTPEESLGIDSDTYNKIVDECIFGEQNDHRARCGGLR